MEEKWQTPQIEKLILLIQDEECLYNIKSKEYMDRTKKALALNQIKEKLETDMVGVTVQQIVKKWKNLRGQYVRELRLIENSKKSGSGKNDVHKPKLWCFDQLKFLQTHCAVRKSVNNVEVMQSIIHLESQYLYL